MTSTDTNTSVVSCDFNNPEQRDSYLSLLNQYMVHPMGGMSHGLDTRLQQRLVHDMLDNPRAHCFLLRQGQQYVGFSTCYMLYSTFHALPYLYIHDIFVNGDSRDKGLGTTLLNGLIDYARQSHCCKVTLEVRADNAPARHVYAKAGFIDLDPPMSFWTKELI